MALHSKEDMQNKTPGDIEISMRRLRNRRWRRNAVAVLLAGTLVVGVSVPVSQLSVAYATNSQTGNVLLTAIANTADSSILTTDNTGTSNDAGDTNNNNNTNNNNSNNGNENSSSGNTNNTPQNPDVNTNPSTPSAEETTPAAQEANDPNAATPNQEFGAPTTDVVIEGSVNGEIMARIALAEPDGQPVGGDYNKYNYGSGEPWCAYFVMYCARAAGLSTSVIPNNPGCIGLVSYYQSINRWQPFTTKYTPHVGDLIFYSSSYGGVAEHIGIVVGATETTVTTREGNTNNAEVATHVFSTTDEYGSVGNSWYILGYASPEYPATASHEHTNQVHVTQSSDTGHLVTYDDCACGYHKNPEIVSHNFQPANAGTSLEDADEWVCVDCGFKQPHYKTGILQTTSSTDLYDSTTGTMVSEKPAGSVTVTSIELRSDGNYWGKTANGYLVRMNQTGAKGSEQFDEINQQDEEQVSDIKRANPSSVSETILETGDASTVVSGTGQGNYRDTTAVEVGDVKKGNVYLLEIKSVESLSELEDTNLLGKVFCKLIYKDQDGNWDTSAFKYYGANSYKLSYSQDAQQIIIAPDFDATVVLASQYGLTHDANDVRFSGVTLRELR